MEEARYNGNPKNISLHRVTLQDALEQGFLKKLKESLPEEHEVSSMDEGEYFDYIKIHARTRRAFYRNTCANPPTTMPDLSRTTPSKNAYIKTVKTGKNNKLRKSVILGC